MLEALLAVSESLAGDLDLDRVIQKVTDAATRLCRAQFGAFFYNRIDESGESYMLYALSGIDRAAFAGYPMPRNTAVFAPTFRGEAVVRLDDVTADPRYGKMPPHHGMPPGHPPVRSYLAVPVRSHGGEVIGGLFFGHPRPGVFRAEDEALLVAVAAQAAVAIDNARLYETVTRARDLERRRACIAEEVGLALTCSASTPERVQRVCEVLVEHKDAALARVWLLDEAEQVLVLGASAGPCAGEVDAGGAQTRVPVGEGPLGAVARSRRPHLDNRVPAPAASGASAGGVDRIVAVARLPVVIEDRLLGVLALFARNPLSDASMKVLGGVADQLAVALERERIEEEQDRFRELFIGMLGHDLRNPLSAISTGVQSMLMSGELDPVVERRLARMRRSTGRMKRMVDQLLDFARTSAIGAGLPLSRMPCDLRDVARDVVEELREAHPDRVILEEYAEDAPGVWDADRMAQVLSNLLGNAIAHGDPEQAVRISIHREGNQVTADVHNHGAPIPPAALRSLFDPYRRAREGKAAGTGGLGLGLYISSQIVSAHGGSLDVTSTREAGTRFRVCLPVRAQERAVS